ncbi:uncharacterized protein LOC143018962 isoform X3 [Oratosquilla oratoria]|uniref:uncharacterized protein LOC143018962 isoform X3 n=1 Tax=Oratosquilla oratoria TaxID=337810 RepID=UPI003F7575C8
MILDNRKVPDIVVSEEGINNNNNNNNNNHPRGGNGGVNGNGSPRRVNSYFPNPRHGSGANLGSTAGSGSGGVSSGGCGGGVGCGEGDVSTSRNTHSLHHHQPTSHTSPRHTSMVRCGGDNGNGSPKHSAQRPLLNGRNGNPSPVHHVRNIYYSNGAQPPGQGSPKHVNNSSGGGGGGGGPDSPRHVSSPKPPPVTYGSPKHCGSPKHFGSPMQFGSPKHHEILQRNLDSHLRRGSVEIPKYPGQYDTARHVWLFESPKHSGQFEKHIGFSDSPKSLKHHDPPRLPNHPGLFDGHKPPTQCESPKHTRHHDSPRHSSGGPNGGVGGGGSPRHTANLDSPRHNSLNGTPKQLSNFDGSRHFSFDSPKHVNFHDSPKHNSVSGSPRHGATLHGYPPDSPAAIVTKRTEVKTEETKTKNPSKIPVQVSDRNSSPGEDRDRERVSTKETTLVKTRSTESPKTSPWKRPKGQVPHAQHHRKTSEPEIKVSDFKSVVRDYSALSPKRVNLRNKNQNFPKKPNCCRAEVRDKPTSKWSTHLWKYDGEKWNSGSKKWNVENGNLNSDSGKWNIEIDKSEEENDQVDLEKEIEAIENLGSASPLPGTPIKLQNLTKDPTQKGTPQPGTPQKVSSQVGTPQRGTPHGTPKKTAPQVGTPQKGPPQVGTPQKGSLQYGTPQKGPPQAGTPKKVPHSQVGTPQKGTPRPGTPQRGTSQPGTPQKGNPRPDTPQKGTPVTGTPQRGTPRSGTPQRGTPQRSVPNRGNTLKGTPQRSYSQGTSIGSDGSSKVADSHSSSSEWDSGLDSVSSKMVLIRCKDASYLTKIVINREGIHALKVVGRVGVGGTASHVMSLDQSGSNLSTSPAPNSYNNHDDAMYSTDGTQRDLQSVDQDTASVISQATDAEFEHDTADYQWLLDYEYRESYCRDGSGRASVLDPEQHRDLSYDDLARNLDANLAEIDMDDFCSEDIHNLLTLPTMCGEFQQSADEGEMFASVSRSMMDKYDFDSSVSPRSSSQCGEDDEERDQEDEEEDEDDGEEEEECEEGVCEEEEYSGVSGDMSLYQSGPLFSPLKDPPQLPNTTFSVDSLDCESLHEDLILTCQANKDNYTIAFEGSFVQYSEDSDYHEAGESDTTDSNNWSTDRIEGRVGTGSPAHSYKPPGVSMIQSDQPYTTWSRVSRRNSKTPEIPSRAQTGTPTPPHRATAGGGGTPVHQPATPSTGNKSNSMPNLMRRSLMRRSLEAAANGQCVKVFDLQNSMRASQSRSSEGSNFSLVKLFMKQKSLSKEAVSLSSSCTDRSQEGACSTSDNHSEVHDSSDWPMNSGSENDMVMDGSSSPIPPHLNNAAYSERERLFRRRVSGNLQEINQRTQNSNTTNTTTTTSPTQQQNGVYLNNNIIQPPMDNETNQITNTIDNAVSFEDSLTETSPCSKPPMTSPIREEPEGMDISMDSRGESKVLMDQSEKETKNHEVLRLKDKMHIDKNNMTPVKMKAKDVGNKNIYTTKNAFNIMTEERQRSKSPGTPKRHNVKTNNVDDANNQYQLPPADGTRRRQDSGNSSSGYLSNRGSTEKIRRSSESDRQNSSVQKPKPKPRVFKQMADQCLQTSNLKVSATVNTSGYLEKKEVYVYYPNYALPDLGFLKDKKYNVDARVFLVPQHYKLTPEETVRLREHKSRRPFSCGDMEKLRKHGFGHVRDWDSLNFLLPKELKEMLLDDTECMETTKPSFCHSRIPRTRPVSCCEYTGGMKYSPDMKGSGSSASSTQPSSGFRGSSTLLNESEVDSAMDQRYIYRYDSPSTDSEGFEKPPPLPRRSISLPVDEPSPINENDTPPPRPPLPRGILRKAMSLKSEPQKITKRHSTFDPGRGSMREDLLKRRSLQEPMEHLQKGLQHEIIHEASHLQASKEDAEIKGQQNQPVETPPSPMGCSCVNQCTGFCAKGLKKKNLLRVCELPEVSSHEDFSDEDLLRLRSQVSNFLSTKGGQVVAPVAPTEPQGGVQVCESCACRKKTVSFAEKVCVHLRNTPDRLATPPNSPDVSQLKKGAAAQQQQQQQQTQQPQPQPQPQQHTQIRGSLQCDEEDPRPLVYDSMDKRTLVISVRAAVEKLVQHFATATNQADLVKLGTSTLNPVVAQVSLEKLCPAIYALLSDGLQPSLHSLFGKINNSVWRVIEATSQLGTATKALNDLVLTLNSEESLSEGPIKFNAFIFGLLNIRSLDSWLGYLRTRESIIQKHYHPEAFLYLSNTATRPLFDDLLVAVRPLTLLPFNLDLLHEYKALHASLQKMEERLHQHTSYHSKESPGDRPPSVLDHLLASKETKEFKNAAQQDRVKALMRVLTSPDIDETELLQSTAEPSRERSRSPRPRSCYENVGNVEENHPAMKKRWSGVQLGSKLLTAIDKLMMEEAAGGISSGEDYTDSLDNPKVNRRATSRASDRSEDDVATDLRVSDISSKDGDFSERSASDKDTENEKGLRNVVADDHTVSEGMRFRRLQLKWEQMTGLEAVVATPAKPSGVPKPVPQQQQQQQQQQNQSRNEKSISPGAANRSRIPRPVSMTSPQRPFKPFDPSKDKTSPQMKQVQKLFGTPTKDSPKPAPRRSLKDKTMSEDNNVSINSSTARPPSVRSRLAPRSVSTSNMSMAGRASSVPGRVSSSAGGGGEKGGGSSRYGGPRRMYPPRSASHGRSMASGERLVQTLHHRLATDNGHLSFNRGDILHVVVEVDERYLLCCHNDRKGLVPRASVIFVEQ